MPRFRTTLLALLLPLGLLAALGARGASYAANRPEACRSCHRMEATHAAWRAGSHARIPCQACHVPQGALAGTGHRLTSGVRHGLMDPLLPVAAPLGLHASGQRVVEANCRRCHSAQGPGPIFQGRQARALPGDALHARADRSCLDCHGSPHPVAPPSVAPHQAQLGTAGCP